MKVYILAKTPKDILKKEIESTHQRAIEAIISYKRCIMNTKTSLVEAMECLQRTETLVEKMKNLGQKDEEHEEENEASNQKPRTQ